MSELVESTEETPPKSSKKPLVIGLVLMILFGAGGFYAAFAGLLPLGGSTADAAHGGGAETADISYVKIPAIVVSLGANGRGRYLHFTGELEVVKAQEQAVTLILPRVLDVLNSYLRAVETTDLEDPLALVRLRAQMLRRVQMVVGEGQVRDLLVTEFVIN